MLSLFQLQVGCYLDTDSSIKYSRRCSHSGPDSSVRARPALAPVDTALTGQSLGDQAPDPEAMARLLQMIKEQHVDRGREAE